MTKTEIALTIARQYTEVEREMYKACDLRENAKAEYNLNKLDEHYKNNLEWARSQVKTLRSNMETIATSKDLLGISKKQWYDAINKVYIEYSNKEKELA